jgi:peroxiredoxin
MNKPPPAERAPGESGPVRKAVRVAEALLWIVVAGLFVWRISPQVRAAVGWGGSGGTAAPPVTFVMLEGGTQTMADLRGQVVLVNFWATWCPPCRAEMPGFQDVYEAKRSQGFTVLGVSMDDLPRDRIVTWLRERDITYPVARGTAAVAAGFGGVNSYPTSFLIDRRGRVRYTVRGIFAEVTLRAAVDRLLAEAD